MNKVLFFDNSHEPRVDKSVTGGFGSVTDIKGPVGRLYTTLKHKSLSLPPLSLSYGISIFKSHGWEVHYSTNLKSTESIHRPDLIFVHAGMPSHLKDTEDLKALRNRFERAKIIVFGTFPSVMPDVFDDYCDHVITDGEPENAFLSILEGMTDLGQKIKLGQFENLDDLPFPLWEYFPYQDYRYRPFLPKGPALPIMLTRGCPYNCDYCNYMPQYGANIRYRSIPNVLKEIKSLLNHYNVKNLVFRDLVFTLNQNYVKELCNEIKKYKLDLSWSIETRTDLLDFKILEVMRDAGLCHINLGIESINEAELKKIGRKPDNIVHQEEVIKAAEQLGIKVSAFYILGLPKESKSNILSNINYAKKLNTFAAQFCILTPYPGTKLYTNMESELLTKNWENFTAYDPVVKSSEYSSEELLRLRDKAYKSYYTNPKWILKHGKDLLPW
ncbi:MAG: radical SAM protein [Bacteriovoracaceae bacterium]|nr:radical SAM protein [Bacteriovoracaceae bacterium]